MVRKSRHLEAASTPRGRGRPRIGPAVEVSLPPAIWAEIKKLEQQTGTYRTDWIRVACESYFEPGNSGEPPVQ